MSYGLHNHDIVIIQLHYNNNNFGLSVTLAGYYLLAYTRGACLSIL